MPIAKLLILHNARCGDIQCVVYVTDSFIISGAPSRILRKEIAAVPGENDNETGKRIAVQIKILIRDTEEVTELTKKCDGGMSGLYYRSTRAAFASAFIYSELISFSASRRNLLKKMERFNAVERLNFEINPGRRNTRRISFEIRLHGSSGDSM